MNIQGSPPPQATSLDLFAKNQDLKIFDLPLLNCHFPPTHRSAKKEYKNHKHFGIYFVGHAQAKSVIKGVSSLATYQRFALLTKNSLTL